jgi:hypothetical protein
VPRNNIVEFHGSNRFSLYGEKGALVENVIIFFMPDRIWDYQTFGSESPIEGYEDLHVNITLRKGWVVRVGGTRSFVHFDPEMYQDYSLQSGTGKFIVPEKLDNQFKGQFSVTTPVFQMFNASLDINQGGTPIYPEAAAGRETRITLSLAMRPTESIRIEGSSVVSRILRTRNDSEFARTVIPRLKVEYQPRRSLFFRLVAEYRSERQVPLEDPRTGERIYVDGAPSTTWTNDGLRVDVLASYYPTPGTVAYFGYGSSLKSPRAFGFSDLERVNDGFFIKLAYLFRY